MVQVYAFALSVPTSGTRLTATTTLCLNPFPGFGGGTEVAVAPGVGGGHGVIFVAPGPGTTAGVVNAYDGVTGANPAGFSPVYPFGVGYGGGIALAATNNLNGTGTAQAVMAGMMTDGSAIDLYAFSNNSLATMGQIVAAFPSPLGGKTTPIIGDNPPGGSTTGVGSLGFGNSLGLGTIVVGTAFATDQNGDVLQFPSIGSISEAL